MEPQRLIRGANRPEERGPIDFPRLGDQAAAAGVVHGSRRERAQRRLAYGNAASDANVARVQQLRQTSPERLQGPLPTYKPEVHAPAPQG